MSFLNMNCSNQHFIAQKKPFSSGEDFHTSSFGHPPSLPAAALLCSALNPHLNSPVLRKAAGLRADPSLSKFLLFNAICVSSQGCPVHRGQLHCGSGAPMLFFSEMQPQSIARVCQRLNLHHFPPFCTQRGNHLSMQTHRDFCTQKCLQTRRKKKKKRGKSKKSNCASWEKVVNPRVPSPLLTFTALAVAQEDIPAGAGAAVGAGEVDAGVGAEPGTPFPLVHLALVEVCGETRGGGARSRPHSPPHRVRPPAPFVMAHPGRGRWQPCRSCGSRARSCSAGSGRFGHSGAGG